MAIWRIRISCWVPKATRTLSEYVIYIALPLQQWLHKSASMLRYYYFPQYLLDNVVIITHSIEHYHFKEADSVSASQEISQLFSLLFLKHLSLLVILNQKNAVYILTSYVSIRSFAHVVQEFFSLFFPQMYWMHVQISQSRYRPGVAQRVPGS